MKQIIETKMVEQTTIKFVANDGKEFTGEGAEQKCKQYEDTATEEIVKRNFAKVMHKEVNLPLLDWFGDNTAYLVRMHSKDDWYFTKCYFDFMTGRWGDVDIPEPKEYPYTQLIIAEDCGTYGYCRDLKNLTTGYAEAIDEINNFIK